MMRLDKMLSHTGYGSRKEAKELIRKGFVSVNGETILDDDFKVDEENDEVIIADNNISYDKFIYIMLNKPDGYVSATYDSHDPIVLDLIDGYEKRKLFPVGRLDKDTVGLLLLTNDGDLAHRMLSPKKHVIKRYYLKFDGILTDKKISRFEEGITLEDGYLCMPASYEKLSENEGILSIKEGKYHQVKRMLEALDCTVTYLKRISFGPIELDKDLEEGKYRFLTEEELKRLK